LQELILTRGGPYWDGVTARAPALDKMVDRGRQRLARETKRVSQPATVPLRWYRRPWLVSLATAAAVLLVVVVGDRVRSALTAPPASAWGWDRPGALAENVPPDVYLARLADEAQEWFKQRPETATEVARRIGQFRQGCSTLLLAEHKPLSEAERKWLGERCRAWAEKFDQQLTALEAGEDPLQVRDAMDATVNQLTKALRERAEAHS
jgi:hypothetical protein